MYDAWLSKTLVSVKNTAGFDVFLQIFLKQKDCIIDSTVISNIYLFFILFQGKNKGLKSVINLFWLVNNWRWIRLRVRQKRWQWLLLRLPSVKYLWGWFTTNVPIKIFGFVSPHLEINFCAEGEFVRTIYYCAITMQWPLVGLTRWTFFRVKLV